MIGANISKETRKRIYRREGYACAVCSSPRQLEIHHVVKRSQGGSNDEQNLVALCHNCHCLAHGERVLPEQLERLDLPFGPDDVEFAIIEYLADYYAETAGQLWWPYEEGRTFDHHMHPRGAQHYLHKMFPRVFPRLEWPID